MMARTLLVLALLAPGCVVAVELAAHRPSGQSLTGALTDGAKLNPTHSRSTQPATPVWGCNSLNRGVALTFDDGPVEATNILLDNLKALGVKATFFVCGSNVQQHPDIVRRAFNEGHEIGLHTWTHANMTDIYVTGDSSALQHELWDNEALVMNITGVKPRLFRPPYGAITPWLVQLLADRGYTTVMWSGGCIDWWINNMTTAIPYMVNGMADSGTLLCLHDSYPSTCEGITELVQALTGTQPDAFPNPQGRPILSWDECIGGPGGSEAGGDDIRQS